VACAGALMDANGLAMSAIAGGGLRLAAAHVPVPVGLSPAASLNVLRSGRLWPSGMFSRPVRGQASHRRLPQSARGLLPWLPSRAIA